MGGVTFTEEQIKRYGRHIVLKEVGGKGQRRIMEAKVLVVGAGGLGSPAAYYLAAAGVGRLGILDFDDVEISNLQRQILHFTSDLGRPKVESAKEKLKDLNPDCEVVVHRERLTSENALSIIEGYDIVLDGSDNFPTRYLVNDACVMLGKPLVHGSILQFEGQVMTILPRKGPCYRCLFPSPPPPGAVPSCQEAGVLGSIPGVIGCIMATEALKLVLEVGRPLVGRLLVFDALRMEFTEVKVERDKDCAVCGEKPKVTELIDYEEFCALPRAGG